MDTGWLYGSNARNIETSKIDWSNVNNAKTDDGSHADCIVLGGDYSDQLNVYTFGANIPTGATLTGIEYAIERYVSAGGATPQVRDFEIYLMDDTTPKGNNKADTISNWPTSDTFKYYGGSSDLWGASWTPVQVNASTFGLVIKTRNHSTTETAYVDVLAVKIYYIIPSNDHLMMMGI